MPRRVSAQPAGISKQVVSPQVANSLKPNLTKRLSLSLMQSSATQPPTPAELEEMTEMYILLSYRFRLVDSDNSGAINKDELRVLLKTIGLDTSDAERLMVEFGSDELQLSQFIDAVTTKVNTTTTGKDIAHAFSVLQRYDKNCTPSLNQASSALMSIDALALAISECMGGRLNIKDAMKLIEDVLAF